MNKVFGFSTSNIHIKNNLDDIASIASFFKKHGRLPSRYSKEVDGKKLAEKLHNLKKSRYLWYREYEEQAKLLGCPNMFVPIKPT